MRIKQRDVAKGWVSLTACLLLTAAFAYTANSPDAAQIISRSVLANDADWKAAPNYSHRERDVHGKLTSNGEPKVESSKTFEVSMINGSPYERLIAINNEPLSPEQEAHEQKKLREETLRRQNESESARQARIEKYKNERANDHFLMMEMVKAFDFKLVGEEQVNGNACYVLDATPKPDYHPASEKAKVLTGMKGRLWVLKESYHWVRVQAEVTKPVSYGVVLARVRPGTQFELEQAPVDNVWLPQRFVQSVNARILGLYGMQNREESDYSDYSRTAPPPKS